MTLEVLVTKDGFVGERVVLVVLVPDLAFGRPETRRSPEPGPDDAVGRRRPDDARLLALGAGLRGPGQHLAGDRGRGLLRRARAGAA